MCLKSPDRLHFPLEINVCSPKNKGRHLTPSDFSHTEETDQVEKEDARSLASTNLGDLLWVGRAGFLELFLSVRIRRIQPFRLESFLVAVEVMLER